MRDQPYTVRDGGTLWQHVLDGKSVWGVTGPMYDDVGMPCLVVTGDVAAARARLAPTSSDTRQQAIEAIRFLSGTFPTTADAVVDALAAAGLLRDQPASPAAPDEYVAAMVSVFAGVRRAAADALDNAAALLLDWAEYAPDWARDRHNFAADLATVKADAANARAALVAAAEEEQADG